ncbi:MAG: SPOR domain-containing protein, partial [Muribaculaceae bacterium]|nr:SPOR domain-containing protein [Muribaculaceae bacterium]
GFRSLVFSGNNPRTAKNEATNRSELLARQFPEYATYITYDAPYWRLKAGDFRSYDEATSALGRLKTAMPSFAREMRVVRERINL